MALEDWLGGLDSNQDNQIQNLMYCQLYDLPAGAAEQQKRPQARPGSTLLADGNFVNGDEGGTPKPLLIPFPVSLLVRPAQFGDGGSTWSTFRSVP